MCKERETPEKLNLLLINILTDSTLSVALNDNSNFHCLNGWLSA